MWWVTTRKGFPVSKGKVCWNRKLAASGNSKRSAIELLSPLMGKGRKDRGAEKLIKRTTPTFILPRRGKEQPSMERQVRCEMYDAIPIAEFFIVPLCGCFRRGAAQIRRRSRQLSRRGSRRDTQSGCEKGRQAGLVHEPHRAPGDCQHFRDQISGHQS